jgi:proteasome accessory factor A
LEAEGRVKRLCTEEEIENARWSGPRDTRGGIRGLCIARFGQNIKSVQWEGVQFRDVMNIPALDLKDVVDLETVGKVRRQVEQASTPREIFPCSD